MAGYIVATLVVIIGFWQAVVSLFHIPKLILPGPAAVIQAFENGGSVIPANLFHTFIATIAGFGIGFSAGVLVAVLVTEVPLLRRTLYPLTVAFQSMPLIGLAPLLIIWFGFGIQAHAAMASIVAFFPVFTNVVHGMERIDKDQLMLFRSCGASKLQSFRKLKIPATLPFIFAGADVAIVFAMLGVVVAEFLGSNQGMGFLLVQYSNDLDTAGVFELLIVLAALGLALHTVTRTIGRYMLRWA